MKKRYTVLAEGLLEQIKFQSPQRVSRAFLDEMLPAEDKYQSAIRMFAYAKYKPDDPRMIDYFKNLNERIEQFCQENSLCFDWNERKNEVSFRHKIDYNNPDELNNFIAIHLMNGEDLDYSNDHNAIAKARLKIKEKCLGHIFINDLAKIVLPLEPTGYHLGNDIPFAFMNATPFQQAKAIYLTIR